MTTMVLRFPKVSGYVILYNSISLPHLGQERGSLLVKAAKFFLQLNCWMFFCDG